MGMTCEFCRVGGHFCSGVPGILAHIKDGHIGEVQRCDACAVYASDEEARLALLNILQAAPDLLAACKRVFDELTGLDDDTAEDFPWLEMRDLLYEVVRAAIAKATP